VRTQRTALQVAEYDFAQQYSLFTFNSFLIKGELISSIVKVKGECQKVLTNSKRIKPGKACAIVHAMPF
jgi:hypothetical protein